MRILYHHRTQGAEPEAVHIAAIVSALRRLGHEVDIIGAARVPSRGGRYKPSLVGRVKRRMPRLMIEIIQIAYNGISFIRLASALRRNKYDFLYERYAIYNVAGVFAARTFKVPLVLEVNTLYARAWKMYYGLRLQRLALRWERFAFRSADTVITVTDALRKLLEEEGVERSRIAVTHNAIDPEDFEPHLFRVSALKSQLGLPRIVAGFVGTMNPWQGVSGFAEVIERVARVRSDVGFLFVGDGEGRHDLEVRLQRRGLREKAVFVGRQPHSEIPGYVALMDIGLLLDTNAYGSPMKIFEYWVMGKAVIAAGAVPVLEVIEDGITGLVIPPGDAAAMARQIVALADDDAWRSRLGEAGRRQVLSKHTWESNVAKMLSAVVADTEDRPAGQKESVR